MYLHTDIFHEEKPCRCQLYTYGLNFSRVSWVCVDYTVIAHNADPDFVGRALNAKHKHGWSSAQLLKFRAHLPCKTHSHTVL